MFQYIFQMMISLIHPYLNTQQPPRGTIPLSAALPPVLTTQHIIHQLIRLQLIPQDMRDSVLVTTQPRNYFFDLLLSKNQQLYYDEDQVPSDDYFRQKRMIKLPFTLKLHKIDKQFMIDCQTELITTKHFQILQKIGEGTYSEIFLVERRFDHHLFVMKRINKAECRQKGSLDMILNQEQILQYGSKYKVKLYYQFEDTKHIFFILDYCPYGDLYSFLKGNKKNEDSRMTLTEKYSVWIQIAFGIVSLHEKGLIYRDLKPQNILIDERQRIKICDFGFTCKIGNNQKLNSICGSYEYLAPQMVKRQGYDKTIDIYCLGLLFYQMLVGVNPFEGITPKTLHQLKNKPISFEKKQISNTVKDLLKKMLKDKPEQRLGYGSSLQIFRHQFFKQNQDLVHQIIKGETQIKSLKYSPPNNLPERKQLDIKEAFLFPKGVAYNFMRPSFDVTQNVGPKFDSA